MSDLEAFTGGDFGKVAVQLVARSEADRVDDTVQTIPLLGQFLENAGDVVIVGHVAREAQVRAGAPACGELFDAALELVVLVGEGQFRTLAVHRGGDAGGDGQLAGDADDQHALTGEKTHCVLPLSG
ncbi:hypothetical protein D3C86_1821650 [compost metagenome]